MQGLEFFAALRKRWLFVLVPLVLGFLAAASLNYFSTPIYKSTATVYFTLPVSTNTGSDLLQGSSYAQNQLASYAILATTPVVLDPVISKLKLQRSAANLAGSIDAVASTATVLVDISVSDPAPLKAANIANAVAESLGTQVRTLSPRDAKGAVAITAVTVTPATPPGTPTSPKPTRNLIAGGLAGLILGLLLAVGRERLDTRVRTSKDLPPGMAALVTIGFDKTARKFPVVDDSHRRRAEAFRQLRTNLQFVDVDHPLQVIVVTSSMPGEGKSSTAANLAIVFAKANRQVLLVEADMRRPRVSDYLGLDRSVGLSNVLAGQVELRDAVQMWGEHSLHVLPSGSIPPNPSELLGSAAMSELIKTLRVAYDIVILDTPPLLPVTDAAVVTAQADGAVILARYGKATRANLAETARLLAAVDTRIFGAIINMAPAKGPDSVRYDRYSYYQEEAPPKARLRRPSATPSGAGSIVDPPAADTGTGRLPASTSDRSDRAAPDSAEPRSAEPEAAELEAAEPKAAESEAAEPGAAAPEAITAGSVSWESLESAAVGAGSSEWEPIAEQDRKANRLRLAPRESRHGAEVDEVDGR